MSYVRWGGTHTHMIRDRTMTILRVLLGGVVIAFCAGFIPIGGCAKGCSQAGKVGASHADDFARVGTRGASYSDDIARGAGRYSGAGRYGDDLAGAGRYRPPVVVGGVGNAGDDLAMLSRTHLESSVAALPEAEGAVASLARKPTSSGVRLDGLDDAGRNFGKDYARSIDDLAVTKRQHDKLMDAFESAQDLVEPVIEALAGDDEPDATADKIVAATKARERLQLVALELEAELAVVLTPGQLKKFMAQFGSATVVAYRLGKDRPIKPGNDKVAP